MIDIAKIVTTRKTAKAFDPAKKIPRAQLDQLCTLLQFAPSSVNSQPWHFFIASTPEAKQRLTAATQGMFAYNAPKILNASDVVVICARTSLDDQHLTQVITQELSDGRFATEEAKATQDKTRRYYVDLHQNKLADEPSWIDRQTYIVLGTLLLGAAALDIDACAMEGIDVMALATELELDQQGLRPVVMVALGYRSVDDFNAKLPKSRLPADSVITTL